MRLPCLRPKNFLFECKKILLLPQIRKFVEFGINKSYNYLILSAMQILGAVWF